MVLSEILNKICTNNDNIRRPVYIYNDSIENIPDDEHLNDFDDELLCVHQSSLRCEATLKDEFCNAEVQRIYWSKLGFVITVSR